MCSLMSIQQNVIKRNFTWSVKIAIDKYNKQEMSHQRISLGQLKLLKRSMDKHSIHIFVHFSFNFNIYIYIYILNPHPYTLIYMENLSFGKQLGHQFILIYTMRPSVVLKVELSYNVEIYTFEFCSLQSSICNFITLYFTQCLYFFSQVRKRPTIRSSLK